MLVLRALGVRSYSSKGVVMPPRQPLNILSLLYSPLLEGLLINCLSSESPTYSI